MVIVLVIGGDALNDFHRLVNGGFFHHNRLETALQCGVFFDVLAVLGQGGGTNDLNLAAGQGRLQNVGGIHAALGIAGTHNVVDLVNDQNDVAQLLDLVDQTLHAGFKLASELGTSHQSGQVQQINFLVLQFIGDLTQENFLSKTFGDGGFAHAGFADQARVVLLAAVQDLNRAGDFGFAAHDFVQLAFGSLLGQRDAVILKEFTLVVLSLAFGTLFIFFGRLVVIGGRASGTAEKLVQEGEGGGTALVVLVLFAFKAFHHTFHAFGTAESGHHLVGQGLQIFVGNTHFLHHVVHGFQTHFLGTFQTETFVASLAIFNFSNKYYGHIFAAAGTQCRLHLFSPLRMGIRGCRWDRATPLYYENNIEI